MVGHTHEDIDQFFSVISKHLKQLHVICPDLESLLEAIKDAFKHSKDHSSKSFLQVITLPATSIFSYSALYEPIIDPAIAYHQEPHQFRVKTFENFSPNEPNLKVVLLRNLQNVGS